MTSLADALRPIPKAAIATAVALTAAAAFTFIAGAHAQSAQEQVHGYFCNAKSEAVEFLALQAQGENEIMAAEAVNKHAAKFTCAPYMKADAVFIGEQTVISDGLVFKVQSYMFLPEKVERWQGAVFGSHQPTAHSKSDI